MQLKLYSTSDGLNVINKTLNLVSEISVKLPREIDISNFDLVVKGGDNLDLEAVNYAELVDISRKYFVERCVNLGGELWRLELACDLLETYKNDVLNSNARFKRNIKTGDYLDVSIDANINKTVTTFESNKGFEGEPTMILTTIGA